MHEHKYEPAPEWAAKLAIKVAKKWHKELAEAGVTFDLVYVWADEDNDGEPKGPALRHQGYDANAIAQQTSLLHRSLGQADILIRLDAKEFEAMSDAKREALLDHELMHFEIKRDEIDAPVTDDLGRPKLKAVQHDFIAEGFTQIAKRHGKDSPEWDMANAVTPAWSQALLDFREDQVA